MNFEIQDGGCCVLRQLFRQEVWQDGNDADQGPHGHRRRDVLRERHSTGRVVHQDLTPKVIAHQ